MLPQQDLNGKQPHGLPGQNTNDSHQVFKSHLKFFQLHLNNTIRLLGLEEQPISMLSEREVKRLFFFIYARIY